MGPLGHLSVGLAAKPAAPGAPLAVLLLATWILDFLAVALGVVGVEGGQHGDPWSHSLFMAVVWSVAFGVWAARVYCSRRVGWVVGLLVLSHWVLDWVSHPIPFSSFSWRTWSWTYGRPLPSDLPIFFGGSPKVGLGLYNSMSAARATLLEVVMFVVGAAVYAAFPLRSREMERNGAARKTGS
jgi:hypothetical protein